jgi:hypothetical protein
LKLRYRWQELRIVRNKNEGTFFIEGGFSPGSKLIEGSEVWTIREVDFKATKTKITEKKNPLTGEPIEEKKYPLTGAEYEQAVMPYIRGELAEEIAGGGSFEVTYPATAELDLPAHPSHGRPSRIDRPRVKLQKGIRQSSGLRRRPEGITEVVGSRIVEGRRRRELREVHVVEATLVTDFLADNKFARHKQVQVPGTVFILADRYKDQPNVKIIYHIIAPTEPATGTKEFIMRQLRERLPTINIQFIWRIIRR